MVLEKGSDPLPLCLIVCKYNHNIMLCFVSRVRGESGGREEQYGMSNHDNEYNHITHRIVIIFTSNQTRGYIFLRDSLLVTGELLKYYFRFFFLLALFLLLGIIEGEGVLFGMKV